MTEDVHLLHSIPVRTNQRVDFDLLLDDEHVCKAVLFWLNLLWNAGSGDAAVIPTATPLPR